ncbi:MAG: nuclear transport factor 2 family protein [Actinobacteria bacterium]|nr:nuclear transport factor 2 family protein [Actinomycetota bacterium]
MEAVKRLKYRYLRGLDQKLWDEIEDCFTLDATASYGGGAYEFEGREAILAFLRDSMGSEGFLSSHRCGHPEIDLTGPSSARGVWALDDTVIHTEFQVVIRGAAFYEDEYAKGDDGVWRIRHTGYRRSYETMEPLRDDLKVTASWWATDGRSTLLD